MWRPLLSFFHQINKWGISLLWLTYCPSNDDSCRLNPSAPNDSFFGVAVFQAVIWRISALSEPPRRLQKEALLRQKAASVAPVVTPQQPQKDPSETPSCAEDLLAIIKKKKNRHVLGCIWLNPLGDDLCEEYQHQPRDQHSGQ